MVICLIFKTLFKNHVLDASYSSFYRFHINRDSAINQYPSNKTISEKNHQKKILDAPHRGFNGITKSNYGPICTRLSFTELICFYCGY